MAILLKVSEKSHTLENVYPKDKVFKLEELRTFIGSPTPECRFVANEEVCFVVCHHAKQKCLPLNQHASAIYKILADAPEDVLLYGNVLICKTREMIYG